MEAVEKAGINGLLTGGASALLFGTQAQIASPFGNQTIPFPVFTGLVGAGGSLIGDAIHLMMKEAIPISKKANDQASVISGAIINGILFGGLLYAYQPAVLNDFGLPKALMVGAGAEFIGSAGYTYLKENSWL
jgi:hypothetical protein